MISETIREIEEREKSHRKKYEEQKQKINDMGYNERNIESVLHKLIEKHPVLEPFILREMYWSRVRELVEVKKIMKKCP